MKRTAFDDRRDVQIADSYLGDHFACRWCNAMTHRDEMATFGARCRPCWDAYLAERNPAWLPKDRPMTQDERRKLVQWALEKLRGVQANTPDPLGWARRLQEREQAGERLPEPHRSMWRTALRVEAT